MKTGTYYMLLRGHKVIRTSVERKEIINTFNKFSREEQKNLTISKEIFERRARI